MAGAQRQMFCPQCNDETLHVKLEPMHNDSANLGHFVLTIVTCGLWLPVFIGWLVYWSVKYGNPKFHCQVCGRAG